MLLPALLLGVGWCWGVHCLLSEGYLLEGAGKIIERVIGSFWSKPVFTCPPCMSIWHGPFIFFAFGFNWHYVFIFAIALAGINFIIKELLYR